MIETIKEYASKRIDLLKIEATEKSSLSAGLITYFVVLLVAFAFLLSFSILELLSLLAKHWIITLTDS
ncbi:hypothetical protein [Chryseobacterium sp. CH21]|uniref:hypothetical protein n=1 Tax=Chryseobacterium sp. CH21 TaxID=713556 RepID=UPI001E343586|nr:hypothetical protein [Chryseobacterium sp. CH21]